VKEGKAITHRDTDLPQAEALRASWLEFPNSLCGIMRVLNYLGTNAHLNPEIPMLQALPLDS
jgi:hypothetical protein